MRIVYYTHPALFEPALSLVRELGRRVELHLLLEITPTAWNIAGFDVDPRALPSGLVAADDVLRAAFPAGVRAYWQAARTFHLVVHSTRRSLHARSWAISRQAVRFAAGVGADVFHIDDVDVSPRLALGLRGGAPPVVIGVHDPEPHGGEEGWRKRLARRLAFPAARRFVLYNTASRDRFAARHRIPTSAIDVTHLGPYDVFREWSVTPDPPARTVLFFGRLAPYKGLDLFYEAIRLLAARLPDVRVVVAGRPVEGYVPPEPPSMHGAASVEVCKRYLSNSETVRLFQSARVVACPYRDATQSGVVLTAFAFGVPVVATDVGGLVEYVIPGRTGIVVPPGDAAALAAALERVLTDAGLFAELRRGIAAAREGHLSWRATADALLSTYERASDVTA